MDPFKLHSQENLTLRLLKQLGRILRSPSMVADIISHYVWAERLSVLHVQWQNDMEPENQDVALNTARAILLNYNCFFEITNTNAALIFKTFLHSRHKTPDVVGISNLPGHEYVKMLDALKPQEQKQFLQELAAACYLGLFHEQYKKSAVAAAK